MLYNYLNYKPKNERYFSLYQKDVRDYMRNTQLDHSKKIIKKLNITPIGKLIKKLSLLNFRTIKT